MSTETTSVESNVENSPKTATASVSLPDENVAVETLTPEAELEGIFAALGFDKEHELFGKILSQYDMIKQQSLMDGPQKHWLGCCLYTTLWLYSSMESKLPFVFSTIILLDYLEISIMEFMDKLEKWAIMMNAQSRLVQQIETVQGNLSISIIVFQKYLTIFREVFVPGQEVCLVDPTTRKEHILNNYEIYSYIWLAYLGFKKQLVKTREKEDLMNCFHLLLVVIELVINDLLEQNFHQFIRPEFLAELQNKKKSILEYFCEVYNGVTLDCKYFRAHWFQQQIATFVEEGFFKMNLEEDSEFLDHIFFNSDFFHRMYEEAIIDRFEIDERIFFLRVTPEMIFDDTIDFARTVGLRPLPDGTLSKDADMLMKKAADAAVHKINVTRNTLTPLTGKSYLANSDICYPLNFEEKQDKPAQLAQILAQVDPEVGEEFSALINKFPLSFTESLSEKVLTLGDLFLAKVQEEKSASPDFDPLFTQMFLSDHNQVNLLFRRFLQRLALADYQKAPVPAKACESLSVVLQRDDFINSLYVCAMEIVMFSFNSQREFPWSIQVVQIPPITFYKIIEPVIRCDSELTRDMQKHLNRIEERVLEELAWSFDSPIWRTLTGENTFPSYDEVALTDNKNDMKPIPIITPNPSANIMTRFGPQTPRSQALTVKRRLDFDTDNEPTPKKFMRQQSQHSSLTIFARKVYFLAALHLTDLCDRLRMEEKSRKKVWTLLEHILKNETTLMKGRHLDQNIMCSLYIIARVSSLQIPFHEILYHYRHQPQASSRIYRQVLLNSNTNANINSEDGNSRDSLHSGSTTVMRSGSTMPAPGMTSAPPTPEPQNAEYHDLINYYNRVFVRRIEDFVKRLALSEETTEKISLLSVPHVKCNTLSPRKIISPNVSVVPLSSGIPPASPSRPLRYNVNRSPSKDLHHINAVIRQAAQPTTFRIASYHSAM